MRTQSPEFEEFKPHFTEMISKSLIKYVKDTVLKNSRYLFIQTVAGCQFAYCTHCNKRHSISYLEQKLKHRQKEKATCPHCKSVCGVRATGISRKYMEDRAVLVWYEKSRVNPKAITARVISVYRDYSGDYKDIETLYNCSDMYLFEPGTSKHFHLECGRWEQTNIVHSSFDRFFSGQSYWHKNMWLSNIRRAVKGTPFQYSTWEQYTRYKNHMYVSDMIDFFDLAARYPCIEYLTKSGFQSIIWAKLYKNPTHNAVYWRGKTLNKVLRLTKQEIIDIRATNLDWQPEQLRYYQLHRTEGFPIEDVYYLSKIDDKYNSSDLREMEKYAPRKMIFSYIIKQYKKGHYTGVQSVLYDWKDYQRQCVTLGMDLSEERYLFPNNLDHAHQKTTKRIKLKKNREIDIKIKKRCADLIQARFEDYGFLIRPVQSQQELFDEGKILNHCVGGYADQYSMGKTDLYVVRMLEDTTKPYYTLQITNKRFVQCRGLKNKDITDQVKRCVDAFIDQINKKKKAASKQTTSKQEVAV